MSAHVDVLAVLDGWRGLIRHQSGNETEDLAEARAAVAELIAKAEASERVMGHVHSYLQEHDFPNGYTVDLAEVIRDQRAALARCKGETP